MPRFKVIGNESAGIHNLHISNVSLEDDGEYQCQVTPMLPSVAIRASAKLTVLGKCLFVLFGAFERKSPQGFSNYYPVFLYCI